MTKYILHGGYTRENNPDNDGFFREMTSGFGKNVKILLNYFARPESELESILAEDKHKFIKNSENGNLEFEVAVPEKLSEQLERTDLMYMRGGQTDLLINKLSLTDNLKKQFANKTIAGSSAGAYALSKYYSGNDTKKVSDGLGILNLKIYCHYEKYDKDVISQLQSYKENLPLLALPNYKWQIFFK